MKKIFFYFFICGSTGILLECLFTGIKSLLYGNLKATSTTSLWMFFIYGIAVFMFPISSTIQHLNIIIRSTIYAVLILSIEYLTGSILKLIECCPWSYESDIYNYEGLIRLDYFPLWMIAGIIFEKIYLRIKPGLKK